MFFFITEEERKKSKSTCYFEFQKGKYHGKCWENGSVSIRDSLWDEYELSDLFEKAVPDFDYFGVTEISPEQWENILKICEKEKPKGACVIDDVREWVEECFKEFGCFAICGM